MMEQGRLSPAELADLQGAIEQIVRDEFTDSAIEAVHVLPDTDDDGDRILRVLIVLRSPSHFDAVKAKGLLRHIFPVLKDPVRDAFPLVSFLSKSDYALLSAAA